jgi:hypothetical protein
LTDPAAVRKRHPSIWETEFFSLETDGRSSRAAGENEGNLERRLRLVRQATEMSSISSNPETTAVCQDWMVGDAGIEPATPPV